MTVGIDKDGRGYGHDKSLTVTEQLIESRKRLAFYLEQGRDGTSVVEAVRQQIANLEKQQAENFAVQERAKADLTHQGAKNPLGSVAPFYGVKDTEELPPAVSHRDEEHAATQKAAAAKVTS